MGEKHFDKSSVLDNVSGITRHGIYDSDSNKVGEGVGSTREEAVQNAREDLAAQRIADRVEEKLQNK